MRLKVVAMVICNSTQNVLVGVVKGVGKQKMFAPITVFCYWMVGIPLGAAFSFAAGAGLAGLWWGMVIATLLHSLCYGLLLSKRVDFAKAAAQVCSDITACSELLDDH